MFLPLFLLTLAFVALSAVFIFGDLPSLRATPIHKLRLQLVLLWNRLAASYHHIDTNVCHGRLAFYLNAVVPVAYLGLVTFCLHQFFSKTYPVLLQTPHGPNRSYIAFTVVLVYVATALAVFSDPGHASDSALRRFRNNQLIFFDNKVCHTCDLVKPARSKHCSVCNSCYLLYDHHCVWINNCVGYYNYRWFVLYLVANINMLVYGGYVCFVSLQFERARLQSPGWWSLISQTTAANEVTGIFVLLCIPFAIIASLFTALHIRYIYLGVTTNELDKWSEIEHLVRLGALYHLQSSDINGETYLEQASTKDGQTVYISLKNEAILIQGSDVHHYDLRQITSVENELTNIYDRGFWNNARERLLLE
ncbi:zf-DHHC-domain-containing protein [Suhomyces tanzawaensis NRRL Y-17324]|uniref:Palmitoyltransferase n=1 Tax=Suhomyces tanzawaensis NRRL Y-17324 TaxID=984487 RepID=A0A1E4SFM5_9ASCO|nr:zf-DHHC-domain-containing protein [Suhomyces tanzawaensis NRRL Y-17324]ODV78202.1 zf-DHHC-domain-containing protein [Suhomyces tanzawaensis NRRL Y-17324]